MAIRKFLTSVADVYAYDENGQIVFTGKTLLDSSIEVSLGSAPVRGGRGNQLQYIYYHTGEMTFNLTDTQFNLQMLAATTGGSITSGTGTNIFSEETVEATVVGNTVTGAAVLGTPIVFDNDTVIYGWATTPSGNIINGTFTGKVFTGTKSASDPMVTGQEICVRYYNENVNASSLTISANMIPKVVKLVMEAQLNSADVSTNKIGVVQVIAPKVVLSGGFSISMTADGIANTPLTGTALAYNGAPTDGEACASEPYYARIIEVIDSANWYDNVVALAIVDGDFTLANLATKTLSVYAVPASGSSFKVNNADLTFSVTSGGTSATVGANTGLVTATATDGTAVIKAVITSANTIDATISVTVV